MHEFSVDDPVAWKFHLGLPDALAETFEGKAFNPLKNGRPKCFGEKPIIKASRIRAAPLPGQFFNACNLIDFVKRFASRHRVAHVA